MTEEAVIESAIASGADRVYRADKSSGIYNVNDTRLINDVAYVAHIWSYGGNGPWCYFTGSWERYGMKPALGECVYDKSKQSAL